MKNEINKVLKISVLLLCVYYFYNKGFIPVEAATTLPDNHTIEQLKVEYVNGQYGIHVGERKGTLLIRVDKPIKERDVEWKNWSIIKPTSVNFGLYFESEFDKQPYKAPLSITSINSYVFDTKGKPDKSSLEAGILQSGLMRFSGYDFPNYYIGISIYLPKKYNSTGMYYLRGNMDALKEAGQVKAYFYDGEYLVPEAYDRTITDGTFPLMNNVMWGKTELWKGQLGKVTVNKPTKLLKKDANGKYQIVRELKVGDEYRVYLYLGEANGYYGVGSGMFVQRDTSKVLYETPSKKNLRLVRIMNGEE